MDNDNDNWEKPKMKHGQLTEWNWLPYYPRKIRIGKNVDIGAFTFLNAKFGIYLGDNVQIGAGCRLYTENTINSTSGPIEIQENAKIGANSVILPGVMIKVNELIPALSVVYTNKDNKRIIKKVKRDDSNSSVPKMY